MAWNNFHTITPLEIYFQGITDEEGKLYCEFKVPITPKKFFRPKKYLRFSE